MAINREHDTNRSNHRPEINESYTLQVMKLNSGCERYGTWECIDILLAHSFETYNGCIQDVVPVQIFVIFNVHKLGH